NGVGRKEGALRTVNSAAVQVPGIGLSPSTGPTPLWFPPISEYAATAPLGSNSVSNATPPIRWAFQVMLPLRLSAPVGTVKVCIAKKSVRPSPSIFVGLFELRLTVPVSAETVVGRPSTAGVTRLGWVPSLVTPTLNVAVCPAFTVAFRAVLFTSSVLPCGVPPLTDSASCTALSVLTRPAPWWSAGAPRSLAVLVMIRSTSAGDGALPPWVFMYASMTSAAVAAVSGQDALVPPAAQIGGGLLPWSMSAHPTKCAVSSLHSDQPRSPGATTSTVCGLNSVMPSELSAVMLLFSQPPGESCVP